MLHKLPLAFTSPLKRPHERVHSLLTQVATHQTRRPIFCEQFVASLPYKGRFTLYVTSPFRHVNNLCWLCRWRCLHCTFR
jgi:hypothetical protein